jgi:biotin carboxyl carrier protein
MVEIVVDPQRWESMEAGDTALIDQWLVSGGEHVAAGQVLARALLVHEQVDVVAPHAGIVEDILVAAGEPFGPGHVLARMVAF